MPKTKKESKKPVAPKKAEPKFQIEVEVNDVVFKGSGKTLSDALDSFVKSDKFPVSVKTRAIIRYSKGKEKRQIVWHVPMARRMFNRMDLKPAVAEILGGRMERDLGQNA